MNSEANPNANIIMRPPAKFSRVSRPRSISGCSSDSSSATKAARKHAEAANRLSIRGESNQSSRWPWFNAATIVPANSASSSMPP